MWLYFDEHRIQEIQGLKKDDMIFYMLFQVLIIPFQFCIDILDINVLEPYIEVLLIDYLLSLMDRFKNRKILWKNMDDDFDEKLKPNLKFVDHWCFSS
jgi:hypothetical protein